MEDRDTATDSIDERVGRIDPVKRDQGLVMNVFRLLRRRDKCQRKIANLLQGKYRVINQNKAGYNNNK